MKKGWKHYLGLTLLIYSFIPISIVVVLPFLGMDVAKAGALALIFLTTGEISFWIAAALLGKEFVVAFKKQLRLFFRRRGEPKPVSRARHYTGVTLFFMSFIPLYAMLIYLLFFPHKESHIAALVWGMVAGELLGIISFVILGGQFWEKLRHLFDWPGNQKVSNGETI